MQKYKSHEDVTHAAERLANHSATLNGSDSNYDPMHCRCNELHQPASCEGAMGPVCERECVGESVCERDKLTLRALSLAYTHIYIYMHVHSHSRTHART